MTPNRRKRTSIAVAAVLLAAAGAGAFWYRGRYLGGPIVTSLAFDEPAPSAVWPWPKATRETIHPGVTHWHDASSADGTALDLLEFDFRENPGLQFLLFDQDSDDAHPFDNRARYWNRAAGQVARQLNAGDTATTIAVSNGLFFGYEGTGPGGVAGHVAPVVVDGKPHFAGGKNPRWTFGVRDGKNGPEFAQVEAADARELAGFRYASGGAQSLVREGRIAPLPPGSVNKEVAFDTMRTTRVGLGWTRDHSRLYLLIVKEPDSEGPSLVAARTGVSLAGGWTVPDMARFFAALGVWGAINSDAGDAGQLLYRNPDGGFTLIPPKWGAPGMRRTLRPDLSDAPAGGTLMYWVIRDRSAGKATPQPKAEGR